jgi:hypothetical protein
MLRLVALQSFLLVKANVLGPWGFISTKTRRSHVLPLPCRLMPSSISSFIEGVHVFMCCLQGVQERTMQI